MGTCASCLPSRERDELLFRYTPTRLALGLTEWEFWRLYNNFKAANLSETGFLSCPEFLAHIEVSRNSMSERLYNVFRDGNDGISFKNFAIFGWNICATDRESLPVFAFQVYDQQGAGFLCLSDVIALLVEVFGEGYESLQGARTVIRAMCELDIAGQPRSAHVTLARFMDIVRTTGILLHPAFTLQLQVQQHILGTRFWNRIGERTREAVTKGEYDVQVVVDIVNEGKQRKDSYIAFAKRHFVPFIQVQSDYHTFMQLGQAPFDERDAKGKGGDDATPVVQVQPIVLPAGEAAGDDDGGARGSAGEDPTAGVTGTGMVGGSGKPGIVSPSPVSLGAMMNSVQRAHHGKTYEGRRKSGVGAPTPGSAGAASGGAGVGDGDAGSARSRRPSVAAGTADAISAGSRRHSFASTGSDAAAPAARSRASSTTTPVTTLPNAAGPPGGDTGIASRGVSPAHTPAPGSPAALPAPRRPSVATSSVPSLPGVPDASGGNRRPSVVTPGDAPSRRGSGVPPASSTGGSGSSSARRTVMGSARDAVEIGLLMRSAGKDSTFSPGLHAQHAAAVDKRSQKVAAAAEVEQRRRSQVEVGVVSPAATGGAQSSPYATARSNTSSDA